MLAFLFIFVIIRRKSALCANCANCANKIPLILSLSTRDLPVIWCQSID